MNPSHRWQLPLEEEAQGSAAGATFAEQHGLLSFGVNQFNRVAAALIASFAHDQIPSWLDGDCFGVVALGPLRALALFGMIARHHAEAEARVQVVISTVTSGAALPGGLRSLAGTVASFERRSRPHGFVFDDNVVTGVHCATPLFSVG